MLCVHDRRVWSGPYAVVHISDDGVAEVLECFVSEYWAARRCVGIYDNLSLMGIEARLEVWANYRFSLHKFHLDLDDATLVSGLIPDGGYYLRILKDDFPLACPGKEALS